MRRAQQPEKGQYACVGASADADESDVYLLVGLPGAGKYTIARALEALLTSRGCTVRVVDNHYMCNPIFGLVAQDGVTPLPPEVWERVSEVRDAVAQTIERLSPADWSFIFTHVVDTPDDLEWIERLASLAERRASRFVVVRVLCELDELRRRLVTPSRTRPDEVGVRGRRHPRVRAWCSRPRPMESSEPRCHAVLAARRSGRDSPASTSLTDVSGEVVVVVRDA